MGCCGVDNTITTGRFFSSASLVQTIYSVTLNQALTRCGMCFFIFSEGKTLDTLIQTFVAVVVAVLGSNGLWAWLQSRSKAKSARDRMLLGLGHAEIFRVAEKYIHRNAITTDEMEDLEKYLFKPYSELGGNGTAQAIVEKCKQLPIITAAEAERLDTEGLRHE